MAVQHCCENTILLHAHPCRNKTKHRMQLEIPEIYRAIAILVNFLPLFFMLSKTYVPCPSFLERRQHNVILWILPTHLQVYLQSWSSAAWTLIAFRAWQLYVTYASLMTQSNCCLQQLWLLLIDQSQILLRRCLFQLCSSFVQVHRLSHGQWRHRWRTHCYMLVTSEWRRNTVQWSQELQPLHDWFLC